MVSTIHNTAARDTLMNREEKNRNLKNAIIETSRELLLTQGYKVTTIRQITEKAGVTTGSLYHFFRNKEDIFIHIASDLLTEFVLVTDSILGRNDYSPLKYAFMVALELKVIEISDILAESFLFGYSSWQILEYTLPLFTEESRKFFHPYNKKFTYQDYYLRALALRTMRIGFIVERIHKGNIDYNEKCRFIITTSMNLFNVPNNIINRSITKALKLINERDIELYGIKITEK